MCGNSQRIKQDLVAALSDIQYIENTCMIQPSETSPPQESELLLKKWTLIQSSARLAKFTSKKWEKSHKIQKISCRTISVFDML